MTIGTTDYAIGISAGSMEIVGGVVDLGTGSVVRRIEMASPDDGRIALDACLSVGTELASSQRVRRVGIAVPEIVTRSGSIQSAANWDWRDVDVAGAFAGIAPTHVQSDVRAAAFGEARRGAGQGLECFVYITIGIGISAVIVRHGVPWDGRCGAALVLGVPPVEDVAGERALSMISDDDVADALDPHARVDMVARAATQLGEEIGRVVNLIDPDAVIVGGPLGFDLDYRRRWVAVMRRSVWHRPSSLVPVVSAELGRDAEVVGAALAAGALVAA
jgi:glucokinase